MLSNIANRLINRRKKRDKRILDAKTKEAVEIYLQGHAHMRALIHAADPNEIVRLEQEFSTTLENAVTHFIEQTAWGIKNFPQYQDGKGSLEERYAALRVKKHEI